LTSQHICSISHLAAVTTKTATLAAVSAPSMCIISLEFVFYDYTIGISTVLFLLQVFHYICIHFKFDVVWFHSVIVPALKSVFFVKYRCAPNLNYVETCHSMKTLNGHVCKCVLCVTVQCIRRTKCRLNGDVL